MLPEITLALLFFADASTLKLEQVRDDAALAARLLTISPLLTISSYAASTFQECSRRQIRQAGRRSSPSRRHSASITLGAWASDTAHGR